MWYDLNFYLNALLCTTYEPRSHYSSSVFKKKNTRNRCDEFPWILFLCTRYSGTTLIFYAIYITRILNNTVCVCKLFFIDSLQQHQLLPILHFYLLLPQLVLFVPLDHVLINNRNGLHCEYIRLYLQMR